MEYRGVSLQDFGFLSLPPSMMRTCQSVKKIQDYLRCSQEAESKERINSKNKERLLRHIKTVPLPKPDATGTTAVERNVFAKRRQRTFLRVIVAHCANQN